MNQLLLDYDNALDELKIAEQNLDYADPAYIDSAIFKLNAALSKFDAIMNEIKNNNVEVEV